MEGAPFSPVSRGSPFRATRRRRRWRPSGHGAPQWTGCGEERRWICKRGRFPLAFYSLMPTEKKTTNLEDDVGLVRLQGKKKNGEELAYRQCIPQPRRTRQVIILPLTKFSNYFLALSPSFPLRSSFLRSPFFPGTCKLLSSSRHFQGGEVRGFQKFVLLLLPLFVRWA